MTVPYTFATASGSLPLSQLDSNFDAVGASNNVSFTPSGTGAVATTVQAKLRESVSVKDFGAKGDGTTDDSAAIQLAVNYVKTNGGTAFFPAGTYKCKNIVTYSGTLPFSLVGAGRDVVTLKHTDGAGPIINGGSGSTIPYTLQGFTVDCQYSVYASASASHGIAISNTTSLLVSDIVVKNYKDSGILIYGTVGSTYSKARVQNCQVDGLGVAAVGILIANMDESGIDNCYAIGCGTAPGYALELKNVCSHGYITNSYAANSLAGIAFGNDIASACVVNSLVSNVRVYNCTQGIVTGYASNNLFTSVWIDMNNVSGNAIDLQTYSNQNAFSGIYIKNLNSSKSSLLCRANCNDNNVVVEELSLPTLSSGSGAYFESGVLRNSVIIRKISNATVLNYQVLNNNNSGSTTNTVFYESMNLTQESKIVAGVIAVNDGKVRNIVVDTEGEAATDDLDTINGAQDWQYITLCTRFDTRDVTVKNNTGNIYLNGSVDFTLDRIADSLTLIWNPRISKWCETGRGNNL